jgi:hypothetical protein
MPHFGSHLTGPVRHTARFRNQSDRAWFRDLPIGMNDPDFVHHFLDFEKVDDYNTTNYTLSSSGTGTSAAVNTSANGNLGSSAMSVNGALLMQTGSTAGNFANVQSKVLGWQLDRTNLIPNMLNIQDGKPLWFEAAFSADVSASDVDVFLGLSENATSVIGPSGVSGNYLGFRITNGTALVRYVASSASTVTSGSTQSGGSANTVTHTQGTLTKVGFAYNGANAVDFYINRNYMNTFIVPQVPTSPLALTYQIVTNAATNRSLVLDYVYCAKAR